MEHTKGKLEVDGYTYLKDSNCKVVATTNHINGLDFEQQKANAKEIVLRWEAFENGGIVDELRTACEEALKSIQEVLSQHGNYDDGGRRVKLPIERTLEVALAKVKIK